MNLLSQISLGRHAKHSVATDVEGIFRLNGSAKRIKELQTLFDSPDRYGKGLDWSGYTVHDAANILRRYLNLLPQPIVPLDFYERARDPLRSHQAQAVGDMEAQVPDAGPFDHDAAITTYQKLITELPPLNRQLLLYILDLLAVFSSKSEQNRMTSANLAAIFQPGLLSHPSHDMSPNEYRLSQDVLIFLIENQDNFLFGMSGTAADDKTMQEVQSGAQPQASTPTKASHAGLGRSASNASGGADSLRKAGALRRNASVSSKNSNLSTHAPSPGSPAPSSPLVATVSGGGVQRSNTLPSKKSPGLNAPRFSKVSVADPSTPGSERLSPGMPLAQGAQAASPTSKLAQTFPDTVAQSGAGPVTPTHDQPTALAPVPESAPRNVSKDFPSGERLRLRTPEQGQGVTTAISAGTPSKDKKHIFSKSPSSENERKEAHKPNKLRKKTRPSEASNSISAQSSTHSLHEAPDSPPGQTSYTSMPAPGLGTQMNNDPLSFVPPTLLNTQATPSSEAPPCLGELDEMSSFHVSNQGSPGHSPALRPAARSPAPSPMHSNGEESEGELGGNGASDGKQKRRSRWRLSSSGKNHPASRTGTPSASRLGSSTVAEKSSTSIGSGGKPRKSMTHDSSAAVTDPSAPWAGATSSNESTPFKEKDHVQEQDHGADEREKKGLFSRIKAKVTQGKEERKEREAEKDRAKSPPRNGSEHATSKQSLGGIAQEGLPVRGRSTDVVPEAQEKPGSSGSNKA